MSDETLLRESIKNLHRVYYTVDPFENKKDLMIFHHALEHCFNAAGIVDSVIPDGNLTNEDLLKMAENGEDLPDEKWEFVKALKK